MNRDRDTASRTRRGRSVGLLVAAGLVVAALGLSGCIVDAGVPVAADTAVSTVRVSQGATAANVVQTLDEYGLFYSTDRDDVVAIDQGGSASVVGLATIVTNPDVKQVRILLTHSITASEVGTFTVNAKKLTPGTTYHYRLYSIGRDSDGTVWRFLYGVGSHTTADPTLKSLKKSKGTLSPAFSKTKYAYTNAISRYTSSSKITVVPTLTGSVVEMRIDAGAWGLARSKSVAVSRGHSKTLSVRVTEPGGIVAIYTVLVSRHS
jgi:hypothetical protein